MTLMLLILGLSFIQNISFTLVSRARNRNNMWYHALCSVFSNGTWLLTVGLLATDTLMNHNYWAALPYMIGTVTGSLFGAVIAIKIEKIIGATT